MALDGTDPSGDAAQRIERGVCADCFSRLVAGTGESFAAFLESLHLPVYVVDGNGRVVAANAEGCRIVSLNVNDMRGRLGGEVFRCRYADLPGGCGETLHCKTCAIRLSVGHTFETGEPCIRVPAYVDLGDIFNDRTIRFLVSTEKVNNAVLIRVMDLQSDSSSAAGGEPEV
jgi:PAS domain-containing protein